MMAVYVLNIIRSVQDFLATTFKQILESEKFPFARKENDTELSTFRYGGGLNEGSNQPREQGTAVDEVGGGEDVTGGDVCDEAGGDEFGGKGHKISEWQAGWNVTNAIQGMFLVSLPYAVLYGGYWAIFALLFVAYVCCHTGKILVACLYEPNDKGELIRVRDSYVAIAETCLGEKWGGKMVNAAQIIELLMTCILYVVLCGDLMIGTFPEGSVDQRSWMMICTMLLLSCAFLRKLTAVSSLSFWCTVAHIFINVAIFGYCLGQSPDWQWGKVQTKIDFQMFPVTLGVVVFSYTSQVFLPTLEGNMIDKTKFHCMLNWSHIAAGVFKASFAWIAFLTWGEQTQEVITNNLPTRGFKGFINFTLVVKALLSYPLPYYAAAHLLEESLFKGKPDTTFPSCYAQDGEYRIWAIALRVLLVLFTVLLAISIPHFAILMGLIGSFTGTMLSFVWPCYFHMKLKWSSLSWGTIAWEVFIISIGVIFGLIGVIKSSSALVAAYHIPLPMPPRV